MSTAVAKGCRVRITKGLAAGVEGVVGDKYGCLFGRGKDAIRQWEVVSDDLVRKRIMREDHLEPIDGSASDPLNLTGAE